AIGLATVGHQLGWDPVPRAASSGNAGRFPAGRTAMHATSHREHANLAERQWAAGAHVAALVLALMTSWTAGFAGMLAAGVVYLVKRDESPFITAHAREAFNFNLSMFLYACAV